jgi:tetratricopeptide (TPR) repeat protein
LGGEHPSTAITLYAIGQTLHAQGKYEEALSYYERSLAITEKVLGGEHPETAITRFELGRTLLKTGDPRGKQEMRDAARVLENHFGPEHPQVRLAKSYLDEE